MDTALEVTIWVRRVEARGWELKKVDINCFPSDYKTWDSYIMNMSENNRRYMKVLFLQIKWIGLFMGGNEHRVGIYGTPIFNDNKFIAMEEEEWEQLMVLIWSKIHNKNYKNFYDIKSVLFEICTINQN